MYVFCVINVKYKEISWRVRRRRRKKVTFRSTKKTRAYKPLFRKKRFLVNLKTERNASKFAMFMEKENPRSFFCFSFRATFIFPL